MLVDIAWRIRVTNPCFTGPPGAIRPSVHVLQCTRLSTQRAQSIWTQCELITAL